MHPHAAAVAASWAAAGFLFICSLTLATSISEGGEALDVAGGDRRMHGNVDPHSVFETNRLVLAAVASQERYELAQRDVTECEQTADAVGNVMRLMEVVRDVKYTTIAGSRRNQTGAARALDEHVHQQLYASLRAAILERRYKDARNIVKSGGDVLRRGDSEHRGTLLHLAAMTDTPAMPVALFGGVGAGGVAGVDTTDAFGRTALHTAAARCAPNAAVGLLVVGADIFASDDEGYTPLQVARGTRSALVQGCRDTDMVLTAASTARLQHALRRVHEDPALRLLVGAMGKQLPAVLAKADMESLPHLAQHPAHVRHNIANAYVLHGRGVVAEGAADAVPRDVAIALFMVSGGVVEADELLAQRVRRWYPEVKEGTASSIRLA